LNSQVRFRDACSTTSYLIGLKSQLYGFFTSFPFRRLTSRRTIISTKAHCLKGDVCLIPAVYRYFFSVVPAVGFVWKKGLFNILLRQFKELRTSVSRLLLHSISKNFTYSWESAFRP